MTEPNSIPDRGERLADLFGDKKVLFMGNHGVATIGKSVAEAYDLLYYVERAAQVQLYAMWTGQKLKTMPPPILERTMNGFSGQTFKHGRAYDYHFAALKRLLDRREPAYCD